MNQIAESLDLVNRRSARRFAIELPITAAGRGARTLNISATGIRFVTRAGVPNEMELRLQLPDQTLTLSSETVWSQPLGNSAVVGAHFKPSKDLHKLCNYLYEVS